MNTPQFKLAWKTFACAFFLAGIVARAQDTATNSAPATNAPARLVIVKAVYGDLSSPDATMDVTKQLAAMVADDALTVVVDGSTFEDPASGVTKQLRVDFTIDGVPGSKSIYEHGTLKISPKDKPEKKSGPSKLVIRKASYGVTDGDTIDVTSIVAGMVKDDSLSMNVNSDDLGDPAVGMTKQLLVDYTLNGKDESKTTADGDTLKISANGE